MMPYNHQYHNNPNNGNLMPMSRSSGGKHNNHFSQQFQSSHQGGMTFGMGNNGGGMMMQHQSSQHQHHQQQQHGRSSILKNEVFVGNLSYFCDENDLFQLFDGYAEVTNVRIVRNAENNRTLMFGFVTLSTVNEAKEMSKLLNGQLFMARKLRVDVCYQNHDSRSNPHTNPGDEGYQLHVSFSSNFMLLDGSEQQQLIRPTEYLLRKIFIKFGSIVDASVKEYNVEPTIQEGYGFVTFESFDDATRVPKQLTVQGINFLCSLTHKHNPMFKHGHRNNQHHHQQQHHQHGNQYHNNAFGGHNNGGFNNHGGSQFHHHSGMMMNDMGSSVGSSNSREHSDSGMDFSGGNFDLHSDGMNSRGGGLEVIPPSGFGSSGGAGRGGILNLNSKHGSFSGMSSGQSPPHMSTFGSHLHSGSGSGSLNMNSAMSSGNASNPFPSLHLNGSTSTSTFMNPPSSLSIVDRFIGLPPPPSASSGNSSPGNVPVLSGLANSRPQQSSNFFSGSFTTATDDDHGEYPQEAEQDNGGLDVFSSEQQ